MTANTVAGDLLQRVRVLETQLADLQRLRSTQQPNLRDLRDADLTKVTDGQIPVYQRASGRWEAMILVPPFSLPGNVALATSGRFYPHWDVRVQGLLASLKTAGTTTTTVALLKNGTSVATVNLVASDLIEFAALDQTWLSSGDYFQVQVTAAGTGAAGLTVQVS